MNRILENLDHTYNYTGLQKKISMINFQYSVSFSPAEYEYTSHFFASRPDFPKFYNKGLKINKIGCLEVVFMLKLNNKFDVLHTWSVSQVYFSLLSPFWNIKSVPSSKKNLQNKFIIMWGVYKTLACNF